MANVIGQIKGYHGGAKTIANIYDAKQITIGEGETKVLMHFDSSATRDECGNTWTTAGSPTLSPSISSAQYKFGGKSLYLDGSSYLYIAGNAPNFFGKDFDFTVDWWEYRTRATSYGDPVFTLNYDLNGPHESVGCGWIDGIGMAFSISADSIFTKMGDIITNQWVHRACVKSGNNYYMFQNGTLYKHVESTARPTYQTSYYMLIGKSFSRGTMFQGYIDELRVVNKAMWTSNFTPPTSAYTKTSGLNAVNANMLIRHGNANRYIPLTTDASKTTKPCLAVRHGSTNYYAIK